MKKLRRIQRNTYNGCFIGLFAVIIGMFIIIGVVCGDAEYAEEAGVEYVFNMSMFLTGVLVSVTGALSSLVCYVVNCLSSSKIEEQYL